MTAKEFLESKGFDDLREGLYHVFEQDEIELLLNEFAALPCSCEGGHYGYGAAKCFTCGRVKEIERDGHFPADMWKAEYNMNELHDQEISPIELEPVLAEINHINELGLSKWYEVVYFDGNWRCYAGSKTFKDGESVIKWKYAKDCF